MNKKWYASWTIRVNTLFAFIGFALLDPQIAAMVPPAAAHWLMEATALYNIYQRFQTKSAVGK